MFRKGIFVSLVLILALGLLITGCSKSADQKASYPTKDIEVVVPFSAGGGSDVTARLFSKIITEEKYLPVNLNVVNKPGGSAAVGMNYVAGKKGDPYFLLLVTPSYLTTPLQGGSNVNYKDFTSIALLGYDDWFIVVKADSPFKNIKDLLEAAKKEPGKIRVGGASKGSGEHIMVARIADTAGVEFNYVPFQGGSNLTTAIMGGHIEAGILNVSESSSFIEAKQLRALATPGSGRIESFPDVPTFKESGVDVVGAMPRGVVAPGNISPESAKVLSEAFKKMTENPRWKNDYVKKYMFRSDFRGPEETTKFFAEQTKIYDDYLKRLLK